MSVTILHAEKMWSCIVIIVAIIVTIVDGVFTIEIVDIVATNYDDD